MGHRRWTWAVLIVAASGCDRVFGLERSDGGPNGDGSPFDAAAFRCADVPSVMLCADFDESPAVLLEDRTPYDLPTPPGDVTVRARAPGVSMPSALWIDSSTGNNTYAILVDSSSNQVTKLTADFEMTLSGFPVGFDYGLVRLQFEGLPVSSCYVDLQVLQQRLHLQTYCVTNENVDLGTSLPSASSWTHVTFAVDLSTMKTSVTVGGTTKTLNLGATGVGATGHLELGLINDHHVGPILALDNVVVRAE